MGKWVKKYNVNNYDIWIIFLIFMYAVLCLYMWEWKIEIYINHSKALFLSFSFVNWNKDDVFVLSTINWIYKRLWFPKLEIQKIYIIQTLINIDLYFVSNIYYIVVQISYHKNININLFMSEWKDSAFISNVCLLERIK